MSKSIIQSQKECYVTHSKFDLHKHHIFEGPNRKLSEKDGLWIYLRSDWHDMSDYGIHFNKEFDTEVKRIAQKKWQNFYKKSEKDFIKRYGKSYL